MKTSKKLIILMAVFILTLLMSIPVAAAPKVMYIGKKYNIGVSGSYIWSSSNKKIITINPKTKKINTVKEGTAYIIGKKKGKIKKQIEVKVVKPYIISKTLTIKYGRRAVLKLIGTEASSWKSSNKKIATVKKSGIITPVKTGSVTITGTGKNGKKYSCKVTIIEDKNNNSSMPSADKDHIYLIAHRGDVVTAPENTFSAFKTALSKGCTFVETDVRFTKDNVPVLSHNATINAASNGKGYISNMTFSQIRNYDFGSKKGSQYAGEKIPSFQEFIAFCKTNGIHPYIELKKENKMTKNNIKKLYNIVCAAGMQDNVSWVSFEISYMNCIRQIDPTADIGVFQRSYQKPTEARIKQVARLKTSRNTVFYCGFADEISSSLIEKCKKMGVDLIARGISSPSAKYNLDSYFKGAII